jgi:glyoxylase-like metal-dependent hydrolase (beta-lactamase superfamily II)
MKIQLQTPTLTIFESALFRTTSTLIQTDDFVLIIDPNWLPQEVQTIRDFVNTIKENRPIYLYFTHSDYDHIIGYQAFAEAKVIISNAFAENVDKAKIIEQINAFDDEYYIKRNYPIVYPKGDFLIGANGEKLKIGDTELQFFDAAGHNADGLILWIKSLGILVVGDYLSNVEFPYIYHSGKEYLATLNRVEAIVKTGEVKYLITGHGDFTSDLLEIQKRFDDSYHYIFTVINSIQKGVIFDLNELWEQYDFQRIMTKFHNGNLEVLTAELKVD